MPHRRPTKAERERVITVTCTRIGIPTRCPCQNRAVNMTGGTSGPSPWMVRRVPWRGERGATGLAPVHSWS